MRRFRGSVCLAFVWFLGCGQDVAPDHGTAPSNPVKPGQKSFVTLDKGGAGGRGVYGTEASGGMAPAENASPKAPSGREGTVEEADIYRIDGNRLFYLNTYRGFILYDLSNPAAPALVSRLPVHGYPIEMFVTPTTVYALLRDALYLTQDASGLRFARHSVSQLVAIDITNPANPTVLKTIDIIGQLKEGVSRKIDDTLYVVSHLPQSYYYPGYPYGDDRKEQAWVYSFNVANPSEPQLVGQLKVFEGGGEQQYTNSSGSGRWFSGVAISATSNTLHVVENWNTYDYVYGGYSCGSYQSSQEAVVSIIDISDPTGVIKLHSKFSTYGALTDQFKQTYVFDEATQKGYYLGIFARQEWSSSNCSGGSFIQNALESWDITDGAHPSRVGFLPFGKPNETVRGSTFDSDRDIAYAITARSVDPLYAIGISDPANPTILSSIDGLSGDMNVFRLIEGGDFLLGIGRDNSSACEGFGTPATGWATNVAVSIIDVRDTNAIRLVQRQCVAVKNAEWVWSQINWDLDQAHKKIGMHSDATANVISVPVSYYKKDNASFGWWYRYESAVGLMSYDVSQFDPTKAPAAQSVLKNHGTVIHPVGAVERSILFTHQGATPRRMMVNLSDTHLSVVDIEDLDAPVERAVLEVAPYHNHLFRFGDFMVDEVRKGSDYWSGNPGASEFRVKLATAGLEDAPPAATFTVARVQQVFQHGDLLVVFRPKDASSYGGSAEALIFDLSNPVVPALVSAIELPVQVYNYPWYSCGNSWGFWGYYDHSGTWQPSAEGLGGLSWTYSGNGYEQSLVFLDLSTPASPVVTSRVLGTYTYGPLGTLASSSRSYLSLASDGASLIATFREQVGTFTTADGTVFTQYKDYAERFLGSSLVAQTPVNIPGRLVRAWTRAGSLRLLTEDETYAFVSANNYPSWVAEPRLHLLEGDGAIGTLLDSLELGNRRLGSMVGDGDHLFVSLPRSWYYGYVTAQPGGAVTTSDTEDAIDQLSIVDLSADTLDEKFRAPVGTYSSQLMGVSSDRLFVNLPGDGVLAIDVSNLSAPVGQHFVRTLGWASNIAFAGDRAFIGSGNFGVYELDLNAPPSIAVP